MIFWEKSLKYLDKTLLITSIIAKVKVLGPFQVFFTLSCAEMRWSEIFVAVLRRMNYSVEFIEDDEKGWDGSDDNIRVNGKKLWDFVDNMAESTSL